jgi:hypothetical protein
MHPAPLSMVAPAVPDALEATGTNIRLTGDRGRQEWFPPK